MSRCRILTVFTVFAASLSAAPACTTHCQHAAGGASPCADGAHYYLCTDTEWGPQDITATCPATHPICQPNGSDSHSCVAADPLPCAKEVAGSGFDSGNPHIEAVDLNADGLTDLVFGDRAGVSSLMARGDRAYAPAAALVAGGPDWCLADLSGDGKPDLLHHPEGAELLLARGQGDGSFAAPGPLRAGLRGWILACGDLDGDAAADVVMAEVAGDPTQRRLVVVSSQRGFQPADGFPSWPSSDVDRTGLVPLRAGRSALVVERRDRSADVYVHGQPQPAGRLAGLPVAVADLDGDGAMDALVSVWPSPVVQMGDGSGGFGDRRALTGAIAAQRAVTADLDGDGHVDLVLLSGLLNPAATLVETLRGRGDGTFTAVSRRYELTYIHDARAAFVDRGGRPDLLAYVAGFSDEVRILRSDCALRP